MKHIITILCLCFCANIWAQDVGFKKGNFKNDKEGFKAAVTAIEKGDDFLEVAEEKVLLMKYAGNEFKSAIESYLPAHTFNPNSSDLNRKIGHAYLYTNEPYLAKDYLLNSLELNADAEPILYFFC